MPGKVLNITCADRVESAKDSRLNDLRVMLDPQFEDVTLGDDGSMDTIICVGDDIKFRYSDLSEYRDEKTGEFDLREFWEDYEFEIRDACYEHFTEDGLSFGFEPGQTERNPQEGYWRYLISWGGPSEEIRFWRSGDGSNNCRSAEFWFLDWFDGACAILTGEDKAIADMVWAQFAETGTVDHVREEALKD